MADELDDLDDVSSFELLRMMTRRAFLRVEQIIKEDPERGTGDILELLKKDMDEAAENLRYAIAHPVTRIMYDKLKKRSEENSGA